MAIKTVFFGSPEFAVPSLAALAGAPDLEILAVITNPDRPAGRGLNPRPTPVKAFAVAGGVPVFETADLSVESCAGAYQFLKEADVNVVVATSHFVPRWLRELPPNGSINLHPSLLPRWRGAAPIHRAIMAGDGVTGVTIIGLVKEVDAGPIFAQAAETIAPDDTYGSLADRLSKKGAVLITETIRGLAARTVSPREQTGEVTYAAKLTDRDLRVDWSTAAREIERQVRGLSPGPSAYFEMKGARVQLLRATVGDEECTSAPGRVSGITDEETTVECGVGRLTLITVRPAGKREMSAGAFARGRDIRIGFMFL